MPGIIDEQFALAPDTPIWVPDKDKVWVEAHVISCVSKGSDIYEIEYSRDDNKNPSINKIILKSKPQLRNTTLNEAHLDNLTELTYLNEASVLSTIRSRYLEDQIYTYSGLVLASINPYRKLDLYTKEMVWAFQGRLRDELDPHLFAVAEEAFKSMVNDGKNQSIIISGESGAGKTISAKYIMRYFAEICKKDAETDSMEEKVLATNPILESFGNAKTARNDNSSRFGKYIQIIFNGKNEIIGSNIRTFLLEKTRVAGQAENERNYHIFYQMLAGLPQESLHYLGIKDRNPKQFNFLNPVLIDDVDDNADFDVTVKSLSLAGFTDDQQENIFKILAAILHIGNIEVGEDDQGNAFVDSSQTSLAQCCQLLGISANAFSYRLCKKTIQAGSDKVETFLTTSQARSNRDSIAKHLYEVLFSWIVTRLNFTLKPEQLAQNFKFIGVLDIYGFEKFEHNSFEQFCINYANEKLQFQFNQQVFKVEQQLYESEGIRWSFINFNDNQPCIDMIEGKQGILKMIDEECRVPNGSDGQLAEKINNKFDTSLIEPPKFGKNESFTLKHFAYDVKYTVSGFLDKNRDCFPSEQLALFLSSDSNFIADIFKDYNQNLPQNESQSTSRHSITEHKTISTGLAFKSSLNSLMETISKTHLHYIRCIKPNQSKTPLFFDSNFVSQQLRACGIIETIRISSAGFPGRWTFGDFVHRYRMLSPDCPKKLTDLRETSMELLKSINLDYDEYQIGINLIFLRAGVLGKLEDERALILNNSARSIQNVFRTKIAMARAKRFMEATKLIQSSGRRLLGRNEFSALKIQRASANISLFVRGLYSRKLYLMQREAASSIISFWKAKDGRVSWNSSQRDGKVTLIVNASRMFLQRNLYIQRLSAAMYILNIAKVAVAKKLLKELKIESKSVKKLIANSTALESKIVSLSGKLQSTENELFEYQDRFSQLEILVRELESKLENILAEKEEIEFQFDLYKKETKEQMNRYKVEVAEETKAMKDKIEHLSNELSKEVEYKKSVEEQNATMQQKLKELKTSLKKSRAKEFENGNIDNIDRCASSANININAKKLASEKRHQRKLSMDSKMKIINELDLPEIPVKTKLSEAARKEIETVMQDRKILEELDDYVSSPFVFDARKSGRAGEADLSRIPSLLLQNWISTWIDLEPEPLNLSEHFCRILSKIKAACLGTNTLAPEGSMTCDQKYSFWIANLVRVLGFLQYLITKFSSSLTFGSDQIKNLIIVGQDQRMTPSLMVLLQMRSEAARTVEELYRNWLVELFRWFSKIGPAAIMDYQGLTGYLADSSAPQGAKSKFLATFLGRRSTGNEMTTDILVDGLEELTNSMMAANLQSEIAEQIINNVLAQMFAMAFNELLLRKSYATWRRGIQIQFNLSQLEDWASRLRMSKQWVYGPPIPQTEPLVQAVKLLQLAKTATAEDLPIIIETCHRLSLVQIRKILSSYVPDEFEDGPVCPSLMRALALRCQQAELKNDDPSALMLMMQEINPDSVPLHLSIKPTSPSHAKLPPSLVPPTLWKLFSLTEKMRHQM